MSIAMKAGSLRATRACVARGRRSLICKAEAEPTPSTSKTPDWLPEQAGPVLKFLESTDFKLEDVDAYRTYLKPYVDSEFFKKSTGWNELPETINGRAAMIGFVAAAGAEILGSGSILSQLSKAPQPVLLVLTLIVAASTIPIYKGTQGDYLSALKDTYSLPEGVFTERNEKLHGRLAMLGLTTLLLLEMIIGRALL
ncbi:hypothetical protein VOLCADRAFT_105462 [Volvox carteri f. nagariensis]|uniref:Uncharacterized protein n=1 Tax=Volvox carteri f. nagariensis TaxID=3068 RepID=D8U0Z7_VOLCA|nr:uncharacterized protein VOLCADRAFT_105462 [Volvox carteri f. nagariensis]EFJ46470.1 hypothetical protein VOLCADRAFT_105462 [Volvox carteri f. nagariensis]|eukprot:XP_002952327.1 hypothetical protein VOLCADRAFT_105462 [Volvox carteri f. nagariensis]